MLTTPHVKNYHVTQHFTSPRTRTDSLVLPKQWERHMRFGTWRVRSLYRSGSLTAVARQLAMYKLDLVDVQEGRWEEGGTARVTDCIFFLWKRIGDRVFCTPENRMSN